MSDDIVARLREVPNGIGGYFYKTTQQAADEIDRLRTELSRSAIKKTLDHLLAENRVLNAAIDAQAIELAHCNCNRKRENET